MNKNLKNNFFIHSTNVKNDFAKVTNSLTSAMEISHYFILNVHPTLFIVSPTDFIAPRRIILSLFQHIPVIIIEMT